MNLANHSISVIYTNNINIRQKLGWKAKGIHCKFNIQFDKTKSEKEDMRVLSLVTGLRQKPARYLDNTRDFSRELVEYRLDEILVPEKVLNCSDPVIVGWCQDSDTDNKVSEDRIRRDNCYTFCVRNHV